MGDPVVHFEIAGADGARLGAFYRDLFGWRSEPVGSSGGDYRMVDTGNDGLNGGIGSFPNVPPYVTFYVQVQDLETAVAKASDLGGSTVMEPREIFPGLRAAMINDPEGHMVGMLCPTRGDPPPG